MTIRESSICSVVQSFPILLILAQKYDKCLKTPLIYEPPKATPSPEYYEALDALFQNLFGHGYAGHEHGYPGCAYGHGTYGYGKKSNQKYTIPSPCYTFSASPQSYNTHTYPTSISSGYPYLKLSGTSGYKGTYAPTQVYSQNHKYKVVIKKNKKRRPQKLQSLRSRPQWEKLSPIAAESSNQILNSDPDYYGVNEGLFAMPEGVHTIPLGSVLEAKISTTMKINPPTSTTPAIETTPKPSLRSRPQWEKLSPIAAESSNQILNSDPDYYGVNEGLFAMPEGVHTIPLGSVLEAKISTTMKINPPTSTTPAIETTPKPMEHCVVADRPGECVLLDSCDPYVRLLRHQQWKPSPALTRFLQDSHCGFENTLPMVCCPILDKIPDQVTIRAATPAQLKKSAAEFRRRHFVENLPEPPVCGFSNASFSRVVGGVDAKLGDFPWMALLGYERQGITSWNCEGSLVTSRHVLTAAHCIHNQEKRLYVVRLGELDLSREDEGATPVDIAIMKMIMHEQYDSNSVTNDIGVLVMDREVEFTDRIRPICLLQSMELRANNFERYNPIVAGWGNLEYSGPPATLLQAVQIPVVTNTACVEAYKNFTKQVIDERVMCAGKTEGGKDACGGDSGGPLMQPIWHTQSKTTYFHQIGLVSFGKKCGAAGFPGVYTRVTAFMPWIAEKLLGSTPTKK